MLRYFTTYFQDYIFQDARQLYVYLYYRCKETHYHYFIGRYHRLQSAARAGEGRKLAYSLRYLFIGQHDGKL